jgi:hypothetical protein
MAKLAGERACADHPHRHPPHCAPLPPWRRVPVADLVDIATMPLPHNAADVQGDVAAAQRRRQRSRRDAAARLRAGTPPDDTAAGGDNPDAAVEPDILQLHDHFATVMAGRVHE